MKPYMNRRTVDFRFTLGELQALNLPSQRAHDFLIIDQSSESRCLAI